MPNSWSNELAKAAAKVNGQLQHPDSANPVGKNASSPAANSRSY
jgi:hypothetical protein